MSPIWYDAGGFKLHFYSREEHSLPQVAVMAGRRRLATVAVETGEILAGSLTTQQHRRIRKLLAEDTAEPLAAFAAALRQAPIVRLDRQPGKRYEARAGAMLNRWPWSRTWSS
jgi:Domain of unknown function (DUF4160)